MKTIELSKEQIIDRSPVEVVYTDIKRCLSGGYSLLTSIIYWSNAGVRQLVLWQGITLYLVGLATVAHLAYTQLYQGKPLMYVVEGLGAEVGNVAAIDAQLDIEESLALERNEAKKWDRKAGRMR